MAPAAEVGPAFAKEPGTANRDLSNVLVPARGGARRKWQRLADPEALHVYYRPSRLQIEPRLPAKSLCPSRWKSPRMPRRPAGQLTGRSCDPDPHSPRSRGVVLLCSPASPLRRAGAQSHPTRQASSPDSMMGGLWLPHSGFCSIAKPELQGPLSCWPRSPLLFSRWPLLARPPAPPGGWPHTPSPRRQPPTLTLPLMVSWVGLFWGVDLGRRGSSM